MRAAILSIIFLGAMAGLVIDGLAMDMVGKDKTGIVLGLVCIAIICTALSDWRRKLIVWVTEHQICPTLGLLGTVIGFMFTLGGITDDVTAAKLAGVDTALVTTAVGMVVHIWLLVVREATRT